MMKTKTLFLAMVLAVGTMGLAAGNDSPGMAVIPQKGSAVFKVIYKGAAAGKVKLHIFNQQGRVILSETINGTAGFIYPLNFKGLPSGEYIIELVDGVRTQSEKVYFYPKENQKTFHVSKLLSGEGKFLLSVGNTQNENILVQIYDRHNQLIYSESKLVTGNFAQVYKIDIADSFYTFEVSDQAGNRKSFQF